MPDHSKALKYLTKLQGETTSLVRQDEDRLVDALMNPDTEEAKRLLSAYASEPEGKSLKGFLDKYLAFRNVVPPSQSVTNYAIMHRLKATFDHVMTTRFEHQDRYLVSDHVQFGTLETPVLSGMITRVPESDEYLILLNRGLWESLRLYSFFLAAAVNVREFPPRLDPVQAAKCFPFFTDMLRRIVQHQDLPIGRPAITLTVEQEFFWNQMHEAMHAFLFGHEYAHFLHQHFNAASDVTSAPSDSGRIEHRQSSWEKEYEADRTGLDLVVFRFLEDHHTMMEDPVFRRLSPAERNFNRAESIQTAFLGSILFLYFLGSIERLQSLVYRAQSSHPPTWLRIVAMTSVIAQQMPDPTTLQFTMRRIKSLTDSLSLFFGNLTGPLPVPAMKAVTQAERQLQDRVFQSLFDRTHFDTLQDLQRLLNDLSGRSGTTGDLSLESFDNYSRCLLQVFDSRWSTTELELSTVCDMLQRCVEVLEKNADLWKIPRP